MLLLAWPSPVRRRRVSAQEEESAGVSVRLTTMQKVDACRRHGRGSSPPVREESKRTQPLGCRHTGTWKGGGRVIRGWRGA